MYDSSSIDRASLRKLVLAILPTAADLEAFCLDFFPDVAARFASGQERLNRDNLLLELADPEPLIEALQKRNPRRFARHKRLLASPQRAVGSEAKNPYRGLSAFQAEETDLFFGRDALTERLWQRFRELYERAGATRVLAVLGPSGSGKSSVARAGLLAELRTSPIPGPQAVRTVAFKPGDKPVAALAIALLPPSHEPAAAAELTAQRDLADLLRKPNSGGEFDGLSYWEANRPDADSSPFVVLVDQFEEVYTLCTDKQEREAFVGGLTHAAAARTRHVSVVLTLRSDFLGETHRQHPELNRLISDQAVIVSAMSREELRQAIAEPAAQAGQPIDDATVELLLSQAWGSEGTLPLLEFALTRIWEGMQAHKEPGETLRALGGVGGAVAGKAREIYEQLDATEQATARRALVRLVRLGQGARDTRRRAPISELCGRGETEARVLGVLRKFANEHARLVTLSGESTEPLAEVTHEALFEHWTEFRAWIEESRRDRGLYDRAIEATKLWQGDGRPAGRLWRPPDLDLLREYQRRKPDDFGPLAADFLKAAERRQRAEWALSLGGALAVLATLLVAVGVYVTKEQRIRQQLLDTYVERGRQLVFERGNPGEGLLWLHRAQAEGSTDEALPSLLDSTFHAAGMPRAVLVGHGKSVYGVTYSPDGRRIVTTSSDKSARIWEADSGRLVAELNGHGDSVFSATYSPDGRHIVTASSDKTARLWEADSGQLRFELKGHGDTVYRATFSPDGRRIVTASWDKTARVWEADTGRLLAELIGHGDSIYSATYSPDGRHIVTASSDKTARVWEADTGRLLAELQGHRKSIYSATYSPDGHRIVTASSDKTARVWEADTGRPIAELRGHGDRVVSATHSPDGLYIVTASSDKTARVWEADTGQQLAELKGHADSLSSAAYSPDGRRIVTSSSDNSARVWESDSGRLIAELRGHGDSLRSAIFSPDGRQIVTASGDKTARVWAADGGRLIYELGGPSHGVYSVAYSPDGRRIVTVSQDAIAFAWEADGGRLVAELQEPAAGISGVTHRPEGQSIGTASVDNRAHAFHDEIVQVLAEFTGQQAGVASATYSPDSRRIATFGSGTTVRVWDAGRGRQVAQLLGHGDSVVRASYSPDGRRIVTASMDKTARVWAADSGGLVAELRGHDAGVVSAAYCPKGHRIVTASHDNSARVWEADSGRLVAELRGHHDRVLSALYSPDGRHIVTASDDHTARVWETENWRSIIELKGHRDSVLSVTYSPDGHRIVTTSKDKMVRLWEADSGQLVAELKGHGNGVVSAMYSSDGHRIVTASADRTARVWEADNGRLIAELRGHGAGVVSAIFSPDGRRIVTASHDNRARVWDVSPEMRSPEQLGAFIRCHLPMQFDPNNRNVVIPHSPTPGDCPDSAYSR